MKKTSLVTATTFTAVLAAVPVMAADLPDMSEPPPPFGLPAVSGPNWKVGVSGGFIDLENVDTDGRFQGEASFSMPITHALGFQIDGSAGVLDDEFTGSVGGHLFTRDPAAYLLGAWSGYAAVGSNDIFRVGPEAEIYLGSFTLQGTAGFENSDTNGDDVYAYANVAFYPMDDLQLYAGYRRTLQRDVGAAGFEWLVGGPLVFDAPMSIFAEGQYGEDDHATLWAGVRFYFGGPDKSLIRRHREDDPTDPSQALNQLAGQCVPYIPEDAAFDSCGGSLAKKKKKED